MSRRAVHKEMRSLLRQVQDAGWRVREIKQGWLLYPPDRGTPVTVHATSSDGRAMANTLANLKARGLDVRV